MIGTSENKHDLTGIVPLNSETNVKNLEIRLLIKQLNSIIESLDIEIESIETENGYLKDIK